MFDRIFGWLKKNKEDRSLLLTLSRKLQFIVDHRAMGSKTLKMSALMANAIVQNKVDPTACDLCIVIAELEKQRVDFVTIGIAYRCLREAVAKNRIGDKSLLKTQASLDIMQKGLSVEEAVYPDFISGVGAAGTANIDVGEASYTEFDQALNKDI